jgi:hypothetical protein
MKEGIIKSNVKKNEGETRKAPAPPPPRAKKEEELLHQRVKELECVGFKMLSSIGNYMNDSRSGATYVFDYHSPSLDSSDLCSQPAWIDSETGDVLDPSEAFEIYKFEAEQLLNKE